MTKKVIEPNKNLKTRQQVAGEIGCSVRKLYEDIKSDPDLNEYIPDGKLLDPEHCKAIYKKYHIQPPE